MKNVFRGLALAIIFLGLILLTVGITRYVNTSSFIGSRAIKVQGQVLNIEVRDDVEYPVISYTDYNAQRYQSSSTANGFFASLKQGEKLILYIDPSNPQIVRIDQFMFLWFAPLLYVFMGVVTLAAGGFLLLNSRRFSTARRRTSGRTKKKKVSSKADARRSSTSVRVASGATAQVRPGSSAEGSPKQKIVEKYSENVRAQGEAAMKSKRATATTSSGSSSAAVQVLGSDNRTFGPLQPLIDDKAVTDIVVAGYQDIKVVKGGKTHPVTISLGSQEAYETLVERVLRLADTTYSTSKPIADGIIGDDVRIHAVNPVLCAEGPYLTIRVSRFKTVGANDLVAVGTAPEPIVSYLKQMITGGNTILVAGAVGAGKTTLVRALTSEIPEDGSILVIEDTPEVRVEHPNVRYLHTREANIEGVGLVTMADCIRAGLRMAMNRIILGEIRDAEAAEAFIDVCVSGHPGLSTVHARSGNDALNRLELLLARRQAGVDRSAIRDQIATAVQIVVYLKYCEKTASRRVTEVLEIQPGIGGNPARQQVLFAYDLFDDLPGWRYTQVDSFYHSLLADAPGGSPLQDLKPVFGLT